LVETYYGLLLVILTSMILGVEARGAFVLASVFGFYGLQIFLLIYFFSTIPSIIILYGLSFLEERIINRYGFTRGLYLRILENVRGKTSRVTKYKVVYVGLTLFVLIPLPLTGVWTGSLIAYLIGLDKERSLVSIAIGNLFACLILYILVYLPQTIFQ